MPTRTNYHRPAFKPGDGYRDDAYLLPNTAGELSRRAILSAADVRAIRASSKPLAVLAARYGVKEDTIRDIIKRRTWRSVE